MVSASAAPPATIEMQELGERRLFLAPHGNDRRGGHIFGAYL